MRHRTKVIQQGTWYELVKSTNPKTGRHHYEVRVDVYKVSNGEGLGTLHTRIREHFDPARSRGSKWATKWKYRNREEAEKLITLALLKFG